MYYIAYGSNLNLHQMLEIRCRGAKLSAVGYLKDYALAFRGWGGDYYCTIENQQESRVPVAIFDVTPRHKMMLDIYEGVDIDAYYIEQIKPSQIEITEGETGGEELFVYIMNEDRSEYGFPTEDYWETVLAGYENMGFDPKYLEEALKRTERGKENE